MDDRSQGPEALLALLARNKALEGEHSVFSVFPSLVRVIRDRPYLPLISGGTCLLLKEKRSTRSEKLTNQNPHRQLPGGLNSIHLSFSAVRQNAVVYFDIMKLPLKDISGFDERIIWANRISSRCG